MGSSIFLKSGNYAKKISVGTYEKQPRDSTFQNPNAGKWKRMRWTYEVNICTLGWCESEGCSEEPPSLSTSKCLQGTACYYCPVLSRYVLYMLLCVFSVLALPMLVPSLQNINEYDEQNSKTVSKIGSPPQIPQDVRVRQDLTPVPRLGFLLWRRGRNSSHLTKAPNQLTLIKI